MTGTIKKVRFGKPIFFDEDQLTNPRKCPPAPTRLRSVLNNNSTKINAQKDTPVKLGTEPHAVAKQSPVAKEQACPQKRKSTDLKRVAQLDVIGPSTRRAYLALERPLLLGTRGDWPVVVYDPKHATLRLYAHLSDAEHLLVSCQSLSSSGFYWNSRRVIGSVLLTDGDSLQLTGVSGTELVFRQLWQGEATTPVDVSRECKLPTQVADRYILTSRILGTGSYGTVRLAWDKERSVQVACKVQIKDEGAGVEAFLDHSQRECALLSRMEQHPNINGFLDFHEDDDSIYHILEVVTGGDLFGHLQRHGSFPETQAKGVIYQLLLATEFLHVNGIAHRDIKPENILLVNPATGSDAPAGFDGVPHVQLADFGLSCEPANILDSHLAPGLALTPCGTVAYQSPEFLISAVTQQGYCPFALDIWTLGCVSYMTLFHAHPFDTSPPLHEANVIFYMQEYLIEEGHLSERALVKRGILQSRPVEDHEDQERVAMKEDFVRRLCRGLEWDVVRRDNGVGKGNGVSNEAIPFLASLLCTVPDERCTSSEALLSQWIESSSDALDKWYNERILRRRNGPDKQQRRRRQSKAPPLRELEMLQEESETGTRPGDEDQSMGKDAISPAGSAKAVSSKPDTPTPTSDFDFDCDYSYENDPILVSTMAQPHGSPATKKAQQHYGARRNPRSIKSRLLAGGLL